VKNALWLAGSLYYAMLLHFVYDFLGGCIYLRLARDLLPEPAPVPSAAPVFPS
jgi:hypothetical protein